MKNKKTVLSIILFSLTFFLHSIELTSFSFEPEFGFLNGTIVENVWYANTDHSGTKVTYTASTKLSRLDWQLENLPYFGADINTVLGKGLLVNFSFQSAISGKYGKMEDYDWKKSYDPDHLTNYCIHTNSNEQYTNIYIGHGYIFSLNAAFPISITPEFCISVMNFDFKGLGGYKKYESDNWQKYYFDQDDTVIEYTQAYVAPQLSVSTDFDFTKHFETLLKLGITYNNKYNAYDMHEKRHEYFNDRIENSVILEAQLKLYFKFLENHKIGLKGTINYMPDAYGFTYYSSSTLNDFSDSPMGGTLGGTSRLLFTYALVYQFKF